MYHIFLNTPPGDIDYLNITQNFLKIVSPRRRSGSLSLSMVGGTTAVISHLSLATPANLGNNPLNGQRRGMSLNMGQKLGFVTITDRKLVNARIMERS